MNAPSPFADARVARAVRVGDVLRDQYRVDSVLGQGGMGTVYGVSDVRTKQAFAMKVVVDTKDEEHITRFFREGRATMRLKSDHVVRVYDVGSLEDGAAAAGGANVPFMVMERLDGKTLKELVDGKPLDERTVADLMLQACEGLAHAHALGIVHRDVKPSNLFVMHGAEKQLKVLDFGISRMTSLQDWERTATVTVTETHALLGSPHYSSPEQLQSPSTVDARADIWSLGVSMYYALSGRLPFGGTSLAELLVSVMSKKPASLAVVGRFGVSAEMSAIVSRCIERNLDKRFNSVAELAEALAPHASARRAALADRVKSVLANAPSTTKRPSTAPPPPAAKTPRGVSDRTLTVDEPLPDSSATAMPAEPPFEDTTTTTRKESAPPSPPLYPRLEPVEATQTIEDIESPTVAMPGGARGPAVGSMPFNVSVAPAAPAPRKSLPIVGIALGGLALVIGVGLLIAGVTFARKTTPSAVSSSATTPPPTASTTVAEAPTPPPSATTVSSASSTSAADPSVVELELIADARITKVIRPETRRIVVEEGKAIVTVATFTKDLPIEVELANGGRAKGIAKAGGSKSIHLARSQTTKSGGAGAGGSSSSGGTATKPAKSGSELHGSPYQ